MLDEQRKPITYRRALQQQVYALPHADVQVRFRSLNVIVEVVAKTLDERCCLDALLGRVHVRGEDGKAQVTHEIR